MERDWAGVSEDTTNYILLTEWEQKFREAKPRTPVEFRSAAKEIFPKEIHAVWDRYCFGKRKRSWVGIKTAAKQMHLHASFDSQVRKLGDVSMIQTAANTIWGILPEIQRTQKVEKKWSELDFCRLCWRLTHSGNASIRRRPLCEKHETLIVCDHPKKEGETFDKKNPQYRRHHRLLPYFKNHFLKLKRHIGLLAEWDRKVTKHKFPHLVEYIEAKNGDTNDLESILELLLLDVSDPENRIKNEIEKWLATWDGLIFGTFIYAESWLSLIASKPLGGDRKSKNTASTYSKEFKQKAVNRALTSDKPTSQTAKKMGIPENTLYTWIKTAKRKKS